MVVIEVLLMSRMYPNKRRNAVIMGVSALLLVIFRVLIRQQIGIGNSQFLRSMIPHHGGAVLMCEQLKADDPEIKKLCAGIIRSQKEEISQMKAQLERTN